MSLIKCPECKKKISDTVNVCPNCGKELTQEQKKKIKDRSILQKRRTIIILIAVVVLAILGVGGGLTVRKIHKQNQEKKFEEKVKKNTKKYEKNAKKYIETMEILQAQYKTYVSNKKDVWYNCMYEVDSDYTDEYTKDSDGDFYSDFNDALSSFMEDDLYNGNYSIIQEYKAKADSYYDETMKYEKFSWSNLSSFMLTNIKESFEKLDNYDSDDGYNYDDFENNTKEYLKDLSDNIVEAKIALEKGK